MSEIVDTKTIVAEIESLRAMDVPTLVQRYLEVFSREPRQKNREHLWKRIAWKLQEERFGGLSEVARKRLDELIDGLDLPATDSQRTITGQLKQQRKAPAFAVGTVLTRRWRDRDVTVRVVESGVECDGVLYPSLSAAVQSITGSRWNPTIFFNGRKAR